uniref:Uncharacterized protein n=1 Tax=Arundo donax TaxID=35708 RepID=A0A0A8YQC5_ARUDO
MLRCNLLTVVRKGTRSTLCSLSFSELVSVWVCSWVAISFCHPELILFESIRAA